MTGSSSVSSPITVAAECIPCLGTVAVMLTVVWNTPDIWKRQDCFDTFCEEFSMSYLYIIIIISVPVYNRTHIQADIFKGSNQALLHSPKVSYMVVYVDHLHAALEGPLK